MADLLVQTRPVPGIHVKPAKIISRSSTKSISKQPEHVGVVETVQKALKEANSVWLSWKDGLTEYEREQSRLLEERRQVLCQRMKTVRGISLPYDRD